MKKRTVWLALGLVAIMCATSFAGAMTLTNVHTVEASSQEEEATADLEIDVIEAAETSETVQTETETEAAEAETEDAETETETETESETETEEYEPELVAVAYEQEGAWGNVAITNSEKVETGVNIRYVADTESEILGYLYQGTAVWVIEKGDVWTQFYSNGITGYVMTDYLLFGDDVAEIAEVYGAEGVRANWDDVNIYTDMEGSTVKATMEADDVFQVVNDYGHWIEIQYDDDSTAYVSSEDVTSVMLFESATPKDQERVELVKIYGVIWPETSVSEETSAAETEASSSDSSSSGTSSSGSSSSGSSSSGTSSSGSSSSGSSSSGTSSSGSSSSGSSSSGTSSSGSSSSSSGTTASTEAETTASTETEATASTEAETTATEAETSSSSSSSSDDDDEEDDDMGYYDADTDTYYDSNGNVVTSSLEAETMVAAAYYEAETETTASTEAETTASAEAETTASTEAETTAATEAVTSVSTTAASASASTDDTSLLAALIYCEAGNQSYEGMVAVGAVVMNRVASSSFPSTISEVIYQSGQFSPASSGALATAIANGVPSTCYLAASAAIAGEDPTGGALYFNTSANKGIQIGDHWFY